jgi:hypothetical protein
VSLKNFVFHAVPLMTRSKSQVVADYGTFADSVIERARLPYAPAAQFVLPPMPHRPLNEELFPAWNPLLLLEADAQMQSSLLTTVFALRAYQAEQGVYPLHLSQLVRGGYLRRIPADPFSQSGNAAVQYRLREDGSYLLYSVGPDGRDDTGTPIPAAGGNGADQGRVEEDSRGDCVVGISVGVSRDEGSDARRTGNAAR